MDLGVLKRLALYGSPTAKAAALTFLDEASGGELLRKAKKLIEGVNNGNYTWAR